MELKDKVEKVVEKHLKKVLQEGTTFEKSVVCIGMLLIECVQSIESILWDSHFSPIAMDLEPEDLPPEEEEDKNCGILTPEEVDLLCSQEEEENGR